jgi:hypothetical protein
MRAVQTANRIWSDVTSTGVQLREWERKGWTYHAKGTSGYFVIGDVELMARRNMALLKINCLTLYDAVRLDQSQRALCE